MSTEEVSKPETVVAGPEVVAGGTYKPLGPTWIALPGVVSILTADCTEYPPTVGNTVVSTEFVSIATKVVLAVDGDGHAIYKPSANTCKQLFEVADNLTAATNCSFNPILVFSILIELLPIILSPKYPEVLSVADAFTLMSVAVTTILPQSFCAKFSNTSVNDVPFKIVSVQTVKSFDKNKQSAQFSCKHPVVQGVGGHGFGLQLQGQGVPQGSGQHF